MSVELTSDEASLLEPIKDVGQGGALVPEVTVQRSDRGRTVPTELREHVRLGLCDPQRARRLVEKQPDQVGRAFDRRQH